MIQVDIAAGWHSTALTDDGEVYGWGRGEHGRLGFGENDKSSKMVQQKVHLLAGEDIVQKAVAGLRRINLDGLRWRVFDAKGQLLNPTEFLEDIVIEHEHVDCTSSVIQALVLFKKLHPGHRKKEIEHSITNAVRYIENMQMPDGSWYGDWGVCFTYGTWFALGGLAAAGKTFSTCAAMRNGVSRR